jgi:hypothetical protein
MLVVGVGDTCSSDPRNIMDTWLRKLRLENEKTVPGREMQHDKDAVQLTTVLQNGRHVKFYLLKTNTVSAMNKHVRAIYTVHPTYLQSRGENVAPYLRTTMDKFSESGVRRVASATRRTTPALLLPAAAGSEAPAGAGIVQAHRLGRDELELKGRVQYGRILAQESIRWLQRCRFILLFRGAPFASLFSCWILGCRRRLMTIESVCFDF